MQLHIRHETHYVYESSVSYSIQALKLTPRAEPGQRVLNWKVSAPGERIEQVDPYGNVTHIVTVEFPHRELRIVVEGTAEIGTGVRMWGFPVLAIVVGGFIALFGAAMGR